MSINPVQSLGTESGAQASAANLRAPRPQPAPVTVAIHAQEQPGSGTFPNPATQPAQKVAATPERAEDVVQVQHDSQVTDEVIIKYTVQATGRVILQVPSAEVLNVVRGISQDLQQEAKLESKSTAGAVEGVKHGH
jgi:regulator of PEP synthase PpsR (kinase-PPPase family)